MAHILSHDRTDYHSPVFKSEGQQSNFRKDPRNTMESHLTLTDFTKRKYVFRKLKELVVSTAFGG